MSAEKQKTILLVEDEAVIALAEKRTLEKFGYAVITSKSGEEAVETVKKTPALDLVLMDINLGSGIDGTETAAIILKNHDLPVVFLSSHMEPEVVEKTEKITSYGYVVKNSSSTVLDASIKMAFKLFEAKIKEKEKTAALQESEAKLNLALRSAHMGVWQWDIIPDRRIFDEQVCHLLGLDPATFNGAAGEFFAAVHADDHKLIQAALARTIAQDVLYDPEYRAVWPDGSIHYINARGRLSRDEAGRPLRINGIIWEVTERKQAEEEIKRQLTEKEILLREVHHRIKNNIASIGGLLSLHLQSVTIPEAKAVLQDAIGRVNGMRILYDKLLLSEGFKDIAVKNYLDDLIDTIVAIFPNNIEIKIEKHIADFHLDPKRLFPLGLIINELITNKMKYAFIDRDTGRIQISLTHIDHHVALTIQDNGCGLPAGFDINQSKGFGLTLVKMLS